MTSSDSVLDRVKTWVGRSYAEMDCWQLIVEANRLRGVNVAVDYYSALQCQLEPVADPEPWDIVPMCLNRIDLSKPNVHVLSDHRGLELGQLYVDHVGLFLGERRFIHSLRPPHNVTIASLDSERWKPFVLRDPSGRMQFYRVRR